MEAKQKAVEELDKILGKLLQWGMKFVVAGLISLAQQLLLLAGLEAVDATSDALFWQLLAVWLPLFYLP